MHTTHLCLELFKQGVHHLQCRLFKLWQLTVKTKQTTSQSSSSRHGAAADAPATAAATLTQIQAAGLLLRLGRPLLQKEWQGMSRGMMREESIGACIAITRHAVCHRQMLVLLCTTVPG